MKFINQMEPWFDECESQALLKYMQEGGWVTEFRKTREFEAMITEYTGARFCSVVSNGTISLTLALIACGIGKGDEVIVPDYTMVATPNSVKLAGAEVVFVDICLDNLCLDFEATQKAVTPRTKAIILVSINGRSPDNLQAYVDFCKEHNLFLIEDAAQSLGSFYKGKHLGTFGDIGSFSFSAPKVITTGQGGALITDNEKLIDRIRKLRDFGRESGGGDHYLTMGWNFKFTDIQAVIGVEQMKKLEWRVQRKKEIYALYTENFSHLSDLALIPTNLEYVSPWFVDILVKNGMRDKLIIYLKSKNIGTRPFYPALHSQPVYKLPGSFPVSEKAADEGLWLPSSSKLTNEEIKYICSEIKNFIDKYQN